MWPLLLQLSTSLLKWPEVLLEIGATLLKINDEKNPRFFPLLRILRLIPNGMIF
jgi:hypothetical protein